MSASREFMQYAEEEGLILADGRIASTFAEVAEAEKLKAQRLATAKATPAVVKLNDFDAEVARGQRALRGREAAQTLFDEVSAEYSPAERAKALEKLEASGDVDRVIELMAQNAAGNQFDAGELYVNALMMARNELSR